jgi:transposase
LERRRRRAIALLAEGKGLREVARIVEASPGSVHQWQQAWRRGGSAALRPKPTPGRPPKLSPKQRQGLLEILLAGARTQDFPNEVWTLKRIAAVIRRQYGVRYHPSHVWKVLQTCGWSCQVPERRAIQRDEAAIARWMRQKWPAIKKSRKTWRPSRIPRRKRLPAHPDKT